MIDPALFASTPFNNRTARADLFGTLYIYHVNLARVIFRLTGKTVRVPPFGNGSAGQEELQAIQQMYVEEAAALGVAPPSDLASFDLDDPNDWASWTFTISETTRALRNAAGLS